ncbi:PelD GGDEF domain-containing protein [Marinobacter daepoensis]|uniref:PelD GGDEF domain-containing protein n=1 Tax=Marinobacter daepoensis TaxID=262077 RepID=UPI001D178265|nr:PelD GGDEF domain-containing protein [Marinobacter daepoensis]
MAMRESRAHPSVPMADTAVEAHGWLKWLEVVVVTGLFLGSGFWLRPQDPLHVENTFAWPVLAPLLIGLRYGFFPALMSGLLVLLVAGWQYEIAMVSTYPWGWAAGILACSLLAGEFRDYWERQLERSRAVNDYSLQRLEEFTRNFYLMKVSHDRLEQQLAGSSGSLREALRRLYGELSQTQADGLNGERASLMLRVLARYGQLQTAALLPVSGQQVGPEPLAIIGDFREVPASDPLIHYALQERTLVSVQTEFRKHLKKLDTELLVVIPLISSGGELVALCAVKSLPFFSFQNRTLRLLAILSGHLADMLCQRDDTVDGSHEWQNLCFQARRAARDAEQFDLPSVLLRLQVEEQDLATLQERMTGLLRGLDVIAVDRQAGAPCVVLLMPLTDELGLAGYLHRLELDIRESTGRSLWAFAVKQTLVLRQEEQVSGWLLREDGASD